MFSSYGFILLIDPDIIDFHFLRKDAVIHSKLSTPVATNSYIQQQVEFLLGDIHAHELRRHHNKQEALQYNI